MQNGGSRLFSERDIKWLRCVRELIHVDKISIEALKKLLEYAPCWEIKHCPSEQLANCRGLKDNYLPCMLEVAPSKGFSRDTDSNLNVTFTLRRRRRIVVRSLRI